MCDVSAPPSMHAPVTAHAVSDNNDDKNNNNSSVSGSARVASVNEDAHRTTYEELDELYDGMLQRLRQLQQLRERGRAVTRRELTGLRKAYHFADEEKRILDAQHAARLRHRAQPQPHRPRDAAASEQDGSNDDDEAAVVLHAAVAPAAADVEATTTTLDEDNNNNNNNDNDNNNNDSSNDSSSSSSEDYAFERGIAAKASEAARVLCELEAYAQATPLAATYEDDAATHALWSWRSLLHTPSERRLQSLVVSIFNYFTMLPLCLLLTLLLLCASRYTAAAMVAYLVYMGTVGRVRHPLPRHERVARWRLWRYYSDYFPVSLVLPRRVRRRFHATRNYFFVYHPHGVHSFGALTCFALDTQDLTRRLPGIHTHLQTLTINFYVPFWRSLMCALGAGDASAACLRATLRAGPGQSVVVVVGGAAEALLTKPHTNNIVLGTRKGFVRIALQEGSPLVPVYAFGENDTYDFPRVGDAAWFATLQQVVKRVAGFALPAFAGRGYFTHRFGLMPHRRPIVVVVGAPIELPQIAQPTADEVDLWHDRYVAELRKLYNRHCGIYDLDSTGLRITR